MKVVYGPVRFAYYKGYFFVAHNKDTIVPFKGLEMAAQSLHRAAVSAFADAMSRDIAQYLQKSAHIQ